MDIKVLHLMPLGSWRKEQTQHKSWKTMELICFEAFYWLQTAQMIISCLQLIKSLEIK